MKNFRGAKRLFALGCLLACQQFAFAADELLVRAKTLIDQKKAQQAYSLLAPLQTERAGDPEYDYLLARAALDVGKPSEAVFALERFLAQNPDHGPARLELARAYYMMGETKSSRMEFEAVRRKAPPAEVNEAIQRYLGAIDQLGAGGTKFRGYLDGFLGHDGNANSATGTNQIAVPAFGGAIATLSPSASRRSDNFYGATAGMNLRHALSPDWAFNANAALSQRKYMRYSAYDLGALDGSAGLTHTRGVDQYTGALQYQKIYIDRTGFRQSFGMIGQWQHNLDDLSQATVYGQLTHLGYQNGQDIRDANRYVLGTAYSQAFTGKFSPVVYAGFYVGTERPRNSTVPNLGNNFAGLRFGGQLALAQSLTLGGSGSYERRDYRGQEPGFLVDRSDQQTDLSLSLSYVPAPFWTIKPEISHTINRSNVVLYDFSRTQYFVTVRREFN
jgi:tetratricopeptide (TPR) repeat protein